MHELFEPVFLPERDLAVTLVVGDDPAITTAAASALNDHAHASVIDETVESADHGEFIADRLADALERGLTGDATVLLDPAVDVLELALHFEHAAAARRRPELGRVMLRDLVVAAGIDEVRGALWGVEHADDTAPCRLADRLELATLIAIDGVTPAHRQALIRVRTLVDAINPEARMAAVQALPRQRTPMRLLVPGLAHRQAATLGWQCALERLDRIGDGPIDTVVFSDPRPFHPGRLAEALAHDLGDARCGRILRSRGLVRLASRPGAVGAWSSAGGMLSLDPIGVDDGSAPSGVELVFYGERLDREAIVSALAESLVSDAELLAGPDAWRLLEDPLPAWA